MIDDMKSGLTAEGLSVSFYWAWLLQTANADGCQRYRLVLRAGTMGWHYILNLLAGAMGWWRYDLVEKAGVVG